MKTTQPHPKRFTASAQTLRIDRWMARLIRAGGASIIIVVLGIFAFILFQVLPLFQSAHVTPLWNQQLPKQNYVALGMDEWGELPFVVTDQGQIFWVQGRKHPPLQEAWTVRQPEGRLSSWQYLPERQLLAFGTEQGNFSLVQFEYEKNFSAQDSAVTGKILPFPWFSTDHTGNPIQAMGLAWPETGPQLVLLQNTGSTHQVEWIQLGQQESFIETGPWEITQRENLSPLFPSAPTHIALSETGSLVLGADAQGRVHVLIRNNDHWKYLESFTPFGEQTSSRITSMNFILGGSSVHLSNTEGKNRIFALSRNPKTGTQGFSQIQEFPDIQGAYRFFQKSLRNRSFLLGDQQGVALYYATTANLRWHQGPSIPILLGGLSKKYHKIALLNEQHQFQMLDLSDPHPEAGLKSFFGKVHYEGASKPDYVWQSTGGSDSFEPKLSLMPLIYGTLKGTIYALLFAVPIALLAAIYTSQFLAPELRRIVKPIMEVMASLPSVILGFLAALWLAPLIENKIPSLMLMLLSLPLAPLLFGALSSRLSPKMRQWIPEGQEWFLLIPVTIVIALIAWKAGPILEAWCFTVTDPETGIRSADFRQWWIQTTGQSFEQRNSLVVGIIMGFAVIPLVFTLAEDSLRAVPLSLKSASLALGASRWQTAFRVMLPAASAGIFSAIMIGFGRAVGETMIVLMATGNTPLMEWNPFTGMRTLSANLAVELPEAPFHSTLYRTLFLGALILFLMTFAINSLAEKMRQRIRKKFAGL